jgi:hypothetical protein
MRWGLNEIRCTMEEGRYASARGQLEGTALLTFMFLDGIGVSATCGVQLSSCLRDAGSDHSPEALLRSRR